MPSTYSPDLRIELIANGEQSGAWGTTTNINLGTLIEDAISGAATVTLTSTSQAFTAANGAADQARCAAIILDDSLGLLTGAFSVFAPPVTKLYVIKNDTGYQATIYCSTLTGNTTPAGAGYVIPVGKTVFIRSDGTQFLDAVNRINGPLTLGTALGVTSGGTGVSSVPAYSALVTSTANTIAPITVGAGQSIKLNSGGTAWEAFTPSTASGSVSFAGSAPVANQIVTYADTTGNIITTGYIYEFRATSAGQAQLRLYEDADSAGTNYVAIQPPASLASNYTLTLPTTAGSANQVLTTNGSGTLSWTTPASGSGTVTTVSAGNGMTFTDITTSGSVTLGTPSAITSASGNTVSAGTHTHSITGAAFLAGTQTFTGAKSFSGGITSTAFNFTTNDSIFGGTNFITLATGGVSRIDLNASEFTPSPGRDNQISAGSSTSRYSVVYAATGTINTSDANAKQDIADLDDTENRVAVRIKGLIKKFRMKDAVAEKGDAARIHVGVIAQEVRDAFIAEGLDPTRYALFCSDTWWEREEMVEYPPTKEMCMTKKIYKEPTEGATEITRLGVRYDELLAFVIAAM